MVLWFGLKDRMNDIEDKLDKILDRFEDTQPLSTDLDEIDRLPNDPRYLQRVYMAKKIKRAIAREQRLSEERIGKAPPRYDEPEPNGQLAPVAPAQITPSLIKEQANQWYSSLNPVYAGVAGSLIKAVTGYDIKQVLGDEQLLGQLINAVSGLAVNSLKGAMKPANTTGTAEPMTDGLVVAPYMPK